MFAIKHDLHSRQVDFLNAFVQANSPEGKHVYVCPPPGFQHACGETVLKLRKALHGMVESPLLWFNVLKGTLTKLGFQQSEEDKCLFFHPERNIIILTYVDDCLFFGKDKANVG